MTRRLRSKRSLLKYAPLDDADLVRQRRLGDRAVHTRLRDWTTETGVDRYANKGRPREHFFGPVVERVDAPRQMVDRVQEVAQQAPITASRTGMRAYSGSATQLSR